VCVPGLVYNLHQARLLLNVDGGYLATFYHSSIKTDVDQTCQFPIGHENIGPG
jgi:hypothetical protein